MEPNGDGATEPRAAATERRQGELLELLRRAGRVDVGSAAARLGVTQETLRRDMRALEKAGLIRRTYGAAYPVESGRFESIYDPDGITTEEENRIALAAAAMLGTAETVYIDEGQLPLMVARALTTERNLTIVTSSLVSAIELARRANTEVYLVGGRVKATTLATVEHAGDGQLARMVIDLAYMTANGISPDTGLTTPDPTAAEVKRQAISSSSRRIFVGTHTRFGVSTFARFAVVGAFEAIVTGIQLPAHRAAEFTHLGARVARV